jgi:hypothetical protein
VIYVFFQSAARKAPRLRTARRNWEAFRRAHISRVTCRLIGNPIHCSVGNDYGIIDSGPAGHQAFEFLSWVTVTRFDGWFEIPGPNIDLLQCNHRRRAAYLFDTALILKYLTRGRLEVNDCTEMCLRFLRASGLEIDDCWQPRQLKEQLHGRGHPYSRAADAGTCPSPDAADRAGAGDARAADAGGYGGPGQVARFSLPADLLRSDVDRQ